MLLAKRRAASAVGVVRCQGSGASRHEVGGRQRGRARKAGSGTCSAYKVCACPASGSVQALQQRRARRARACGPCYVEPGGGRCAVKAEMFERDSELCCHERFPHEGRDDAHATLTVCPGRLRQTGGRQAMWGGQGQAPTFSRAVWRRAWRVHCGVHRVFMPCPIRRGNVGPSRFACP